MKNFNEFIEEARSTCNKTKKGKYCPSHGTNDCNIEESSKKEDHEYSMARSELSTISNAAKRLRKKMKGEGDIKAWVQSKITKAADYIDTAADYVDSQEIGEACWKGYKKKGMKKMFGKKYPNCVKIKKEETETIDLPLSEEPRIARKPGQPANSKQHSDLYTDENPKGTISGLGFKDVTTAKQSVSKIKDSGKTHAHKIQAAVAMEQRAKEMGKSSEAAVFRSFINSMKEKTKEMNEEGLRDWFGKSKSDGGKPGWVQRDGSPCANEPGETKTPKCFSRDKLSSMSKSEIDSAVTRKRKKDPEQQKKSGGAEPTRVATDVKEESDKKTKGSGTKDACYTKVKSRYSVWPSAYACVPIETSKALTKSGWKSYDQLNIGDEILTFSLEKNNLEFKPIQNLHFYENSPTYVIKNGNTGWKFECTPNHKWVVKYPECKGNRGRKKYTNLINNMQLISIEEILNESGSNRKLVISSKYNEGTPISLDKIYKYETNWVEYLLNCSAEQRESWLYSAIVYDGNQIKTERLTEKKEDQSDCEYVYDTPYNKQSFGFKQKDINHRDAFLLSAFLNEGLVTFRKNTKTNIYSCHYVSYDGTKSLEGFKLMENKKSNVWCPQTENGTWVMMQETDGNGVITITGNSGALVKCRKVGADNWGNSTKNEETNIDENYLRIQTRGSTYTILINWRGKYITTQMFFQKFTRPTKTEVTREIQKVYPNAIVLSFNPSTNDPTKPLLFTGEPNGPKPY